MDIDWIDTDTLYEQIAAASDPAERERLYIEGFVEPWRHMAQTDDPLGVGRQWNWLLPEQLADLPLAYHALKAADAWQTGKEALAEGAARFPDSGIDVVTGWLLLGDPAKADPVVRGYTGAMDWIRPQVIGQYFTPDAGNLRRLPGLFVHELHHLVRGQLFPFNPMQATVGEYIVLEGLAESFAAALFGEETTYPYVTEFSEADLDTARRVMAEGLERTGFALIRGYVFGDYWAEQMGFPAVGMPLYGGYAVGYRLVQAFLERTGTSIEAATRLPAAEIIAGSGYFAA